MCYIFTCVEWAIDLVQRLLTYILACWMSFAVCLGLGVAAMAGVAYGYNYQMAEWLTFTRSDAMVYMRRDQFFERPDVRAKFMARRSGEEGDGFPSIPQENEGSEDQLPEEERHPPDTKLNDVPTSWRGVKGAEDFMNKVNKFDYQPPSAVRGIVQDSAVQADMSTEENPFPRDYYKMTSSPSRFLDKLISISPNVIMSTSIIKSGDSEIIMRNFQVSTVRDAYSSDAYKPNQLDYAYRDQQGEVEFRRKDNNKENDSKLPGKNHEFRNRPTLTPEPEEYPTRSTYATMIMRHWAPPTTTPMYQDYTDEVDEDNIVYRPG